MDYPVTCPDNFLSIGKFKILVLLEYSIDSFSYYLYIALNSPLCLYIGYIFFKNLWFVLIITINLMYGLQYII